MDEFGNKDQLLQAVAQAGSQGAADYKAAQDALAAQQRSAVQSALATSVPLNAEQQGAVGGIISGGYAPHQTQLAANNTANQTYFGQAGAAGGRFFDSLKNTILPARLAANAEELAASGGGGSGGGRGGGGDKSPQPEGWWNDDLKAQFDTKDNLYAYIKSLPGEGRSAAFQVQRAKAQELGVPAAVLQTRFTPSKDITDTLKTMAIRAGRGESLQQQRSRYVQAERKGTIDAPTRRYLVDQYRNVAAAIPNYPQLKKANKKRNG